MTRLILVLALTVPVAAASAQSANDLFQQALRLERSQGDLEGAIELYERVANEHSGDRDTAAQSLFNLGQAYEALGRRDAAEAYRQLIDDYAEYADLVSAARGRLLALNPPDDSSPLEVDDGRPHVERFESELELYEGSVSPDGNFLIGYAYGDLPIQDLRTGEVTWAGVKEGFGDKRSPRVGGDERNTNDWASSGRFSPDMSRIAYAWNYGEMTRLQGGLSWARNEIRVIDRETGEISIALDVTEYFGGTSDWPALLGWTPDGEELVAAISKNRWEEGRMVAVDAGTGVVREVLDHAPDNHYCITGNGRYAIVGSPHAESNEDRAMRVDLQNGGGTWWPKSSDFTSWLMGCDDNFAYRISDTFATSSLQRIPLEDGMPAGEPEVLMQTAEHFMPLGMSERGDLYLQPTSALQTYRAEIDPELGTLRAPVSRLLSSSMGPQDWSDDGKRLLNWSFGICLRVIEQNGSVGNCVYLEDEGRGRLAWLDENSIAADQREVEDIGKYDVRTGEKMGSFGLGVLHDALDAENVLVERDGCLKLVSMFGDAVAVHCALESKGYRDGAKHQDARLSPDGGRVAFRWVPEEGRQMLAVQDLETGEFKEFGPFGGFAMIRWLPDGDRITYTTGSSLQDSKMMLLDATTGEQTEWMHFLQEFEGPISLEFHPDGRSVTFGARPKGLDWRPAVVRNAGRSSE